MFAQLKGVCVHIKALK